MRQCVTRNATRPCFIRFRGTGCHSRPRSPPQETTLFQFGNQDAGRADPVAEKRAYGEDAACSHEPLAIQNEPCEWWLQVKLEHPYNAVGIIEAYKQIAGVAHTDLQYNFINRNPTDPSADAMRA